MLHDTMGKESVGIPKIMDRFVCISAKLMRCFQTHFYDASTAPLISTATS